MDRTKFMQVSLREEALAAFREAHAMYQDEWDGPVSYSQTMVHILRVYARAKGSNELLDRMGALDDYMYGDHT